jgi:hypothetical protein
MNNRTRKFEPARPNLIARTLLMAQAVEAYLSHHLQRSLEIQPVLFFSNPGTHVDIIRPAVRIVLMDGLERFIASLTQTRTFLNSEEVQRIVETLTKPPAAAEGAASTVQAGSGPEDIRASLGVVGATPDKITSKYESFSSRIKLTTPQWVFLGVVGLIEIILLVGFIIYILLTS